MASVAGCPCCSHELLVPDDADPLAWAKCTSCDALFQVKEAATREVGELVLVASSSPPAELKPVPGVAWIEDEAATKTLVMPTVTMASLRTMGDVDRLTGRQDAERNDVDLTGQLTAADSSEPAPAESNERSTATVDEFSPPQQPAGDEVEAAIESPNAVEPAAIEESPGSAAAESPIVDLPVSESVEAAAERLEKWFHSAKTVAETPLISPDSPAPSELAAAAEEGAEPDDLPNEPPVAEPIAERNGELTPMSSAESAAAIMASARTMDDVSFPAVQERTDRTVEFSGEMLAGDAADTDFELAPAAERNGEVPAWDDSEHMERLLAGDNGAQADDEAPHYADDDHPFLHAELFAPSPGMRRRRQSSTARMLIGVVLFGVIGLASGYYVLLAWRGTDGDVLNLAQYLPRAILPSEFSQETYAADDEAAVTDDAGKVDQATFDAPLAENEAKLDEPPPLAPPAATPIAEVAVPHVAGAPLVSADEFAVSLQAAREAQPQLMTGRLGDGDAVRRAKGIGFSLLADLAQKATFVDAAASSQEESEALFRDTLSDAAIRGEVARIVPLWIGSKHRTHGGIFFAGTVMSNAPQGDVIECRVDLGVGEPLTILVPPALAEMVQQSGRPLGFVGSLIDRPAEKISGYHGNAAQAVWIGQVIPL